MIKKMAILAAAAALLKVSGLLPFQTTDVAQLKPVEALVVSVEEGAVVLQGGETIGIGADWSTALEDLRHGAEGTLFLGTTEQVILCGKAVNLLEQVARSEDLRPGTMVVVCEDGQIDPEQAAAYLSAHNSGVTLGRVRAAMLRKESMLLTELAKTEGGLRLYEPSGR